MEEISSKLDNLSDKKDHKLKDTTSKIFSAPEMLAPEMLAPEMLAGGMVICKKCGEKKKLGEKCLNCGSYEP